jgi:hypothetical protein
MNCNRNHAGTIFRKILKHIPLCSFSNITVIFDGSRGNCKKKKTSSKITNSNNMISSGKTETFILSYSLDRKQYALSAACCY